MMARRILGLMAVALSSALFLSGCGDPFPDYHYKMTVYKHFGDSLLNP